MKKASSHLFTTVITGIVVGTPMWLATGLVFETFPDAWILPMLIVSQLLISLVCALLDPSRRWAPVISTWFIVLLGGSALLDTADESIGSLPDMVGWLIILLIVFGIPFTAYYMSPLAYRLRRMTPQHHGLTSASSGFRASRSAAGPKR